MSITESHKDNSRCNSPFNGPHSHVYETFSLQDWRDHTDAIILDLAVEGQSFTVDDVRRIQESAQKDWHGKKLPVPPPNAWGGRFLFAQREGIIRTYGFAMSTRPSRHRGVQRVWIGC